MVKHTPGEWTLLDCSNGGLLLSRGDRLKHPQPYLQIVPKKDAYLISAAPNLLEACRVALSRIQKDIAINPMDKTDRPEIVVLLKKAIAKAVGNK